MAGNKCKNNSQEDEANKRRREEGVINAKMSRLIELVKGYPVLYDLAHPDHKNSEVKKIIWDEIAKVYFLSTSTVLFCIISIRGM